MKKTLLGLFLSAATSFACADNAKVVQMELNIQGIGDTVVVYNNGKAENFVGKGGKFKFAYNIDEPSWIYLLNPASLRHEGSFFMTFPAVPGETMVVKGNESRADITGSKFYKQYHEFDVAIENAQTAYTKAAETAQKNIENGMSEAEATAPALKAEAEYQNTIKNLITSHPDCEASAAIVTMVGGDLDTMKVYAAKLAPSIKNGRMKPIFEKVIAEAEAEVKAEAEAAKKQAAGVDAPDFTLNDIKGNPLSLSSLRGKYVILDFWGSWCVWCRKGMPKMKEYYEKYNGKFEILGVDCRDTQEKWKAAVAKDQLPWLHVYCDDAHIQSILGSYGVSGFPTKILVGPDGKIVKTIVGEDPNFYTFLDETFSK